MKKRILTIIITLCLLLGCFTGIALADTVLVMDWVNVSQIETPYPGEKPNYTYAVNSDFDNNGLRYSNHNLNSKWKNGVLWKDDTTDQYLIPDVDTFIEGHVYTVTVELMAENGYEFYVADGNNGSKNDVRVYYHSKRVSNRSTDQFDRTKYLIFEYTYEACKRKANDISFNCNQPVYNGLLSDVAPSFSSNVKVLNASWTEDDVAVKDTARFKSGKTYKLTINFAAADGYAFEHDKTYFSLIDKDTINFHRGNRTLNWVQNYDYNDQLVITTIFVWQHIVDTNVTHVAFSDIDTPITGNTPDFDFADPFGTCVVDTVWREDGGKILSASDRFEAGKKYKVEIALDAYSAKYNMNLTHATVAGAQAAIQWDNANERYIVTRTFDACAGSVDKITLTINAPQIGSSPSYSPVSSGDGYEIYTHVFTPLYEKNGVWWYDVVNGKNMLIGGADSKFVDGGVYRVKLTLAPLDGYSFTKGVTATVNGKSAFVEPLDNELINVYYYFDPLVSPNPCKNGHTFTNYSSNNDATCCKDGTETAKCNKCAATDTRVKTGTAKGHTDTTKVFRDVSAGKWYVDAINYNYTHEFISGVAKNEFGVNVPVTRGMFITILARIAGVDTSKNNVTTKFTDVQSGKYYTAAIKWASDNKIVNGMSATTFEPNSAIQRQQLCVMIVNFANYQKIELKAVESAISFKDSASIAKWAKDAVSICQKADIVNGYANGSNYDFKPTNTATRAEAAQILYKFHMDFVV